MTWTVEDSALMLQAIAGPDPNDATASHALVPDYSAAFEEDIRGLIIGVPRDYFFNPDIVEPETAGAVDKALADLEGLGARIEEVNVPSLEYAAIANTVIMLGEAFAYHRSNLQSQPQNFGEIVRLRFYVGGLFTVADYVQAQRARARVKREFAETLQKVDVIAVPTSARPAASFADFDPFSMMLTPSFTAPFNETGMPAVSIPCGLNQAGLPIGLQIAGKPFDESAVLGVAYAYQQHAKWYEIRPSL
jgi:aspartyl-tRNA(Asn)/glutamyl-tRNA(Gln) amidotransferase subunit A